MKILLASASPRRLELLRALGYEVTPIPPKVLEIDSLDNLTPQKLCMENACIKAKYILDSYGMFASDIILAADTLVFLQGKPLGKPKNPQEAHQMLSLLSGTFHEVITGYTIITGEAKIHSAYVASKVFFRHLESEEILAYANNPEILDKCGAYAISGMGSCVVDRIEGSISNVVGLPVNEVLKDAKALLAKKANIKN